MAEIKRHGSSVWKGGRQGTGTASTGSGAVKDITITVPSRFESGAGSSPEELIAAAHASCYSMQLALLLERAGTPAQEISTQATLTLDMGKSAPTITKIHLETEGKVPGIDAAQFQETAEKAKEICPVSRLLQPGLEEVSLDARLVS